MSRRKLMFALNRALLVLAVAAVLIGLYHNEGNGPSDKEWNVLLNNEWKMVLNNARILCLSCIGIE
jgi:hypothetical protein